MSEVVEWYLKQGLVVFPVTYGSKKASLDAWQDPARKWTSPDFPTPTNIALRLDGVADIDADNAFARQMCAKWLFRLLNTTSAMYGRPSGGVPTHYLFRAAGSLQPLSIVDDDGVIIEIRTGSSQYSIAPPSLLAADHGKPEDILTWMSTDQTLQPIDADRLTLVIKVIGTICLLARYWPSVERHHTVGALAGLLCRVLPVSMTDTDVDLVLMCQEAATLAGDHEVSDRTRFVKDTYAHWSKQDPTRGGPWLVKHGHERLVELLYGLWDYQGDQRHIDELNEEYALMHLQGGEVRILSERFDGEHYFISYTKLHEFPTLFTQKVAVGAKKDGTPILKNVGSVWLEHPRRRQYRGIEVAPNPMYATPGYYNLWRGFKVEPVPGDWSLFSAHLDLVSDHDPISRAFIFNWMAETVQHPERPIGVALAFRGLQGTGKSTFAKWFGMLFGSHFLHVDSENHLTGRFNKHLQDKIVVLADEAVWAGGKAGLGVLKRMVTETTINIEPKHVDVGTVKNLLHMLIASNEEWVVPAGWDNRRFAVFDVAEDHINDKKFFRAVYEQLVDGGWAALLYDLMQHTVDTDFTDIPRTAALRDQQMQSATFEEEWWLEKLREGSLNGGNGGGTQTGEELAKEEYEHTIEVEHDDGQTEIVADTQWPSVIAHARVYEDLFEFLDKYHRFSRSPKTMKTKLKHFLNEQTPLVATRKSNNVWYWHVPPLAWCRENWAKTHKVDGEIWKLPEKPTIHRDPEEV